MARPIIFLGPTLPDDEAVLALEAEFLPPVQLGDVWRVAQERPCAIGIIDGLFDQVPAVWHKEILFALDQGIPIYGAASMGALRAAELAPYGMVGVGKIFEAYRTGKLEADDEVALAHADAEFDFRPASEPLVNIRATLTAAVAAHVIDEDAAAIVIDTARQLFYPNRTWTTLFRLCPAIEASDLVRLQAWLPTGRVDQKRADAILMLRRIAGDLDRLEVPAALERHVPTVLWDEMTRQETPLAAILEEFLLHQPLASCIRDGIERERLGSRVDWLRVLSAEQLWPACCARARRKERAISCAQASGIHDSDRLLDWFFSQRLGWPDDLQAFLLERGWRDEQTLVRIATREVALCGTSHDSLSR
jgi:hypothetical protein